MRTALEIWAQPKRFWATDLNQIVDDLFASSSQGEYEAAPALRPACDFEETDSHYLFSLDIPGIRKEDLKIEVTGDSLTVEGERKSSGRRADENRFYTERNFGKFSRVFTFPVAVDTDNVEAEYDNGVLRIALAKHAAAKPRRVEIKGEVAKPGFFERFTKAVENVVDKPQSETTKPQA